MSQRDRAERKVHDKHGSAGDFAAGGWGPGGHSDGVNTEHRKAHKAAAKKSSLVSRLRQPKHLASSVDSAVSVHNGPQQGHPHGTVERLNGIAAPQATYHPWTQLR